MHTYIQCTKGVYRDLPPTYSGKRLCFLTPETADSARDMRHANREKSDSITIKTQQ